jgi:glycosyltransferase involved in cell wall biosynthesis
MMKVLMIYSEPIPSGQTTHVLSLSQGLVQKGHRVWVVIPDQLKSQIKAFEKVGAETFCLPFKKVLWKPEAVSALAKILLKYHPDIVHIHSQEAGITGRVLAKIFGAKIIVYTPQTIDVRQEKWRELYQKVEFGLSHITNRIISVNSRDSNRLTQWGIPAGKISTIRNGIDLRLYEQKQVKCHRKGNYLFQLLPLSPQRPIVIQVGRLSAQKAPLSFIDGAKIVLDSQPETQFVMIGDGPSKEELAQRITSLGLEKKIFLAGRIENAHELMAAADVVTLTSQWEGTPYSLLEAMASCRPVVSTAVNGCVDIVHHNQSGFLVEPGNIREWAGKVIELIERPSLAKEMGRQGRKRVERYFSLDEMVSHTYSVYRYLLQND